MSRSISTPYVIALSFLFLFGAIWFTSCEHKPFPVPSVSGNDAYGNYPPEVGKIIVQRCAEGCHDNANYKNNASLRLDTWEHMFEGANNGAVVVAYQPKFSSLINFINTDSTNGDPISYPTMPFNENPPYNRPPLTKDEYKTIRNWIAAGAPDKNGNIPFASHPESRQKVYMTMQGCNLLAVIDGESKLIMRYINLGAGNDYLPHAVHVDPAGQYVYVSFASGNNMQKISTTTDQIVSTINLNPGISSSNPAAYGWNAFHISDDGSQVVVSDLSIGKLVSFKTDASEAYPVITPLHALHGIASTPSFDTFYVSSQYGNVIYKIWKGDYTLFTLDGQSPKFTSDSTSTPDPHEVYMVPGDTTKYFVSCQSTNKVLLVDAITNKVLTSIPVGIKPQEFAVSKSRHLLFVTCMEDISQTGPSWRGSVYAIDYLNPYAAPIRIDGTFFQPHGITVDDQNGVIYIPSRNVNPNGPAPHHTSSCGGRNGYYQLYDLNTLKPLLNDRHFEATPDAYSCEVRFK